MQKDVNNKAVLESLKQADTIVVHGAYDHVHTVLDAVQLPYQSITPEQLVQAKLNPRQTVFVNCGHRLPDAAVQMLVRFVEAGGQLITTDWALTNVIQKGFPDTIAFNNQATADTLVRVTSTASKDPVI